MAILPILQFPDERLRTKAKCVDSITAETQKIISDMIDTMYAQDGIGLAATQVNIHQRIVVIDVSENRDQVYVIINPIVMKMTGETSIEEGCLSVPGIRSFVPRADKVRVRALNREGQFYEIDAEGILAICLQHELDHLDGKLFIDYLSKFKRDRISRKLDKLSRKTGY